MMLNEKAFRRVAAPLANQTAATEDGRAAAQPCRNEDDKSETRHLVSSRWQMALPSPGPFKIKNTSPNVQKIGKVKCNCHEKVAVATKSCRFSDF
jgi:hypothetical protein